jgi:hypothetical protein
MSTKIISIFQKLAVNTWLHGFSSSQNYNLYQWFEAFANRKFGLNRNRLPKTPKFAREHTMAKREVRRKSSISKLCWRRIRILGGSRGADAGGAGSGDDRSDRRREGCAPRRGSPTAAAITRALIIRDLGVAGAAGLAGPIATELFARCERSEKALVGTLVEMYVREVSTCKRCYGASGEGIAPSSLQTKPTGMPMPQATDLSRCLTALEQDSKLIAVIEMTSRVGPGPPKPTGYKCVGLRAPMTRSPWIVRSASALPTAGRQEIESARA